MINFFLIHFLLYITPPSNETILETGRKIWKNECGGKADNLVYWNPNEPCLSLGIGHFIWYPSTVNDKFDSGFPQYIAYLKEKKIPVPPILDSPFTPWESREEFLKDEKTIVFLKNWFLKTIELQAEFIIHRASKSLEKIIGIDPSVESKINHLTSNPNGLFALIDYLNFKGEGLNLKERYQGKGWGLYQVLHEMNNPTLKEFQRSCIKCLQERIRLAPQNEARFLPGWIKRIESYSTIELIQ